MGQNVPGPFLTRPNMWIDCHAHLDRLPEQELDHTVSEAVAAGVTTILSTATDLSSSEIVLRQSNRFPEIYGALGISPFDTLSPPADWEQRLRSMLMNKRVIAAGEIGLDQSNPKYPALEIQLPVFEKQLQIAVECGKPAVVHSRGAERQVAEICRTVGIVRVLFHCFTGDRNTLDYILESGYFVSFSGIITFNPAVANLVAQVPLDRLFIETDTPYLAPIPHRGKPNRPAWAAIVGETAARCRQVSPEALQSAVALNFRQLFLST
jgi:TatD DNase family protein